MTEAEVLLVRSRAIHCPSRFLDAGKNVDVKVSLCYAVCMANRNFLTFLTEDIGLIRFDEAD